VPAGDDLRQAVRGLRRTPGFTLAAVASLALGLGALTAILGLADVLLLRPLPIAAPGELVLLGRSDDPRNQGSSFPYPFYALLADGELAGRVAGHGGFTGNAVIDGAATPIAVQLVSGSFFPLLGTRPHLGRLLMPDDDRRPGAHPVAVLSHQGWRRHFAASPAAVGRTLQVNGLTLTVVGVTAPGFTGLDPLAGPDVFVPMAMQAEAMAARSRLADRAEYWVVIAARVPAETPRAPVEAALDARFQAFQRENAGAGAPPDRRVRLLDGSRGRSAVRERFARPLQILAALSAAILLLVSLNVANLMIARTAARRSELALRLALGSSRARIARTLFAEAALVALAGAGIGLLLARWAAAAIARVALPGVETVSAAIALDARVAAPLLAATLAAAGLCALGPAFVVSSRRLAVEVGLDRRQIGAGRSIGRKALQVAQIAISLALLIGAGLFARTLANLRAVDLGLDADHLLALRIDPTLAGLRGPQVAALHDAIVERVAGVPGVRAVSASAIPLLGRNSWGSGIVLDDGRRDLDPGPERNAVTPGHFAAIGTPLIAGREFDRADRAGAPRVAIVNETFAKQYLGGRALGRRIGPGEGGAAAELTVVGVVRDGKYADLREGPVAMWYAPLAQLDVRGGSDTATRIALGVATLYVRTHGDPAAVAGAAARAVAAIDSRVTVSRVRTMDQQLGDQLAIERLLAGLAAAFAGIATLLAAIGVYGLIAGDAAARRREIGLRLALGATPGRIAARFLAQAGALVAIGVGLGLAAAAAGAGSARAILFGLDPYDPLVIAAAVGIVVAVAGGAAWLPARHAMRVDPAIALRD
jgi:predicted permease